MKDLLVFYHNSDLIPVHTQIDQTDLSSAYDIFYSAMNVLPTYDSSIQPELNNFITIGLFFVFVSLFFKLALAPFHLWSPDVYENSPSSSAFFSR